MHTKIVIITGGSSGIGKACAALFASLPNYFVIITGRSETSLQNAVAEVGKNINYFVSDVSKQNECIALADYVIAKYGAIDILINNAGISMRALFSDLKIEVIKQVMDINFYGTVYTTHACLPAILKSKGIIVGISSIAGYRGLPARTGYSASKFAMQGFLESLRTELLNTGVHVLVVCPGFTNSNIRNKALVSDGSTQVESPLDENKMMSAEVVAKAIYKAILAQKRTLVLTLQGKLTVLLNKFFPKWMDKMVFNHFTKEANSPLKK